MLETKFLKKKMLETKLTNLMYFKNYLIIIFYIFQRINWNHIISGFRGTCWKTWHREKEM